MTKRILILANKEGGIAHLDVLSDLINDRGQDVEVFSSVLSDIGFFISPEHCEVVETRSGKDIASFDFIIFRTVGRDHAEEALAISIYCDKMNIPYIDRCVGSSLHRAHKLATMMALWSENVPMPATVCGPTEYLVEKAPAIGFPAIFKATRASHGKYNYKVTSIAEIKKIINTDNKRFLLQSFIPNKGDYRILVVNSQELSARYRQGDGSSHLNNTSAGGTTTYIADHTDKEHIMDVAQRAAHSVRLDVAGVDIIVDSDNNPYVIEVNRAPQLLTKEERETWVDGIMGMI